ncbi:hypothetical protein BC829DRAFT_127078 [Chytridium lagenaria]|nr:hypothetical protein BC829DRAFT_127078 [Chytridium lagenaria]
MDEAKTWKNPRFIINEKEVYGNHRSELYVEDVNGKHSYSWAGEEDKTVRPFTPLLSFVRDMVQKEVQRLGIEGWCSNAMVANEYRHGKEVTGAHTDKLTYLGPLPTIASVTLGAGRIFRIKRVPRPNGPSPQTYNVLLPHRSLLVMLPPMQEEYKHEIPPQKTVITHHISGEARYNLTFRMYRDDFRDPPSCKCNVTARIEASAEARYHVRQILLSLPVWS